jgi:hypothetical protein
VLRAIHGARPGALTAALIAAALIGSGSLHAQTDNLCNTGEAPDIIVGEILGGLYWGTVGGISAYSFGTDSCNLGTCQAEWFADSSFHPVISQNLFRLKDGRFRHIGQSWLKHGFAAISEFTCSEDCLEPPDWDHLGVNCSDLYTAGLNGSQGQLGAKSDVQARTGIFPWPATGIGVGGNAIYKRLQVRNSDIDPTANPGALYFVEAQYVARDDAVGGNQDNNASHRSVDVQAAANGTFSLLVTGTTVREVPAIFAWQGADPAVLIAQLDMLGRYYIGSRVTDLGNGRWHYEYAVENLNADGAARFTVPVHGAASVSNITFGDVDYHSGELYDGTDWPGVFDAATGTVSWGIVVNDELANALRWGTLYNFGFDANLPPELGTVDVGRFSIEASPPAAAADKALVQAWVPRACDADGVCEPAENCFNCPSDCPGIGATGFCGDGTCDVTSGEDCVSCGQDCAGRQSGNTGGRYCCGDGDGENPVDCSDPRCNSGSFVCASPCCGDHLCDVGEDSCNCRPDCGGPRESACNDGKDDDCDQLVDCADLDCCANAACADGIDSDGDSVAECDCNDANGTVWARPGEVRNVLFSQASTITWSPPLAPGGTAPGYELLRSSVPDNFVDATACLALANPQLTMATDAASPAPGLAFHYLVRARNACPGATGLGTLGAGPSGGERPGRSCP